MEPETDMSQNPSNDMTTSSHQESGRTGTRNDYLFATSGLNDFLIFFAMNLGYIHQRKKRKTFQLFNWIDG